jgi:UDP-4-amino-4,6-dideoxy-N-acetyl-beta-L-altrosamine transaminase
MKDALAINGGKPVRETYLAYGKQSIDDEDIQAVVKVLQSDYLTTGPYVKMFEDKIAQYVGAKYAVALTNGTAALHAACFAAGICEGDEVLVTPMTFAASSNCILYCGGLPVFVDIDEKTGNIDVNKIEEKLTEKTKAIIPVDFAGQSVDIDGIMKIAEEHKLIVIEDGAHALGSEYKGEKAGAKAHMTVFSFHPVKPITTGEGGVVVTNDENLYKKLLLFRTHGITRNTGELLENHGPWYYEMQELGYNYRIPDINCALGASQMNKVDGFITRRRYIAQKYRELLMDFEEIDQLYEEEYSNSGWHIFVIKLNLEMLKCSRKEVYEALQKENIGVNVHYMPVYYHPYYQKLGYKRGMCPNAENFYERIITIPIFPAMEEKDIQDVMAALDKVIKYYKK